jgi:hypothetical protein
MKSWKMKRNHEPLVAGSTGEMQVTKNGAKSCQERRVERPPQEATAIANPPDEFISMMSTPENFILSFYSWPVWRDRHVFLGFFFYVGPVAVYTEYDMAGKVLHILIFMIN